MSSAQLEELGLAGSGELADGDAAELGAARMDRTYPASLEREGYLQTAAPPSFAALQASPASPEFELKAVGGASNGRSGGEKAPLLGGSGSGGGGGSGLLALTAASGSGGIQTFLKRTSSTKQKISPKASLDRDLSRRLTGGIDGAGDEDGSGDAGMPPFARATRRHGSISSEI
jgi:hypothetical protein